MNDSQIKSVSVYSSIAMSMVVLVSGCDKASLDVYGDENKDNSGKYAYILKGESVTLNWRVTATKKGTDTVSISPSIGPVDLADSMNIDNLVDSRVYVLTNTSTVDGESREYKSKVTIDVLDPYCAQTGAVAIADQGLKLTYPEGAPPAAGWPLVVLIHGGSLAGRTLVDMEIYRDTLISNKFAVANINYRLLQGSKKRYDDYSLWPAPIADVKCALRWLHSVPSAIDTDNIAMVGHSAGGLLALLAAYTQQNQEPAFEDVGAHLGQAVSIKTAVVLAAPTSIELGSKYLNMIDKHQGEKADFNLIYGNVFDYDGSNPPKWTRISQASPDTYIDTTQLDNLAFPLMLLSGDEDTLVPPFAACYLKDLIDANAADAGVIANTRHYRIAGAGHGDFIKSVDFQAGKTVSIVDAYASTKSGGRIDETIEFLIPYLQWQLQGATDILPPNSNVCTAAEYELMDEIRNYQG